MRHPTLTDDRTTDTDHEPPRTVQAGADSARRGRRKLLATLTGGLVLLACGVFIAPFAFPIRPPVVQGIRSTVTLSPGSEGARGTALISFKMNEAGSASVTISDPSERGRTLRKILHEGSAPKGRLSVRWDGTDESGARLPDGRYIVNIRAKAGDRSWNSNRPIYIDTTAPTAAKVVVSSAIKLGATGACDVTVTATDAATLQIAAVPSPGVGNPVATRAPAPLAKDATARWSWNGTAKGRPVRPGLYVIRTALSDRLRNTSTTIRTCWVSHGGGAAVPRQPRRGDAIRVQLSGPTGEPLPPSTPVTLTLLRRTGDIGGDRLDVVGDRIGRAVRAPLGRVELLLPRRRSLTEMWLVATTADQRVIIPLRP